MNGKGSSSLALFWLAAMSMVAVCGGLSPSTAAELAGAGLGSAGTAITTLEPGKQADTQASTQPGTAQEKLVEIPIIPLPAARNKRFSLAEKRAAIEGRKRMKAEIAAKKAAQQVPAVEPAP